MFRSTVMFKGVLLRITGGHQDTRLSIDPSQTNTNAKTDIETNCRELGTTDSEYIGAPPSNARYDILRRKTLVEEIEDFERRRLGTRIVSIVYNNVLAGWRAGLLRAFVFSLAALIVNIVVFLWLFLHFNTTGGIGLLSTSNCTEVGAIQTAIKISLNVVSTLILGASTYAMQGTTSPTREEVDRAHKKGRWLEIGTQSWRNLSYVSKKNVSIWVVLALTSLPLHLV